MSRHLIQTPHFLRQLAFTLAVTGIFTTGAFAQSTFAKGLVIYKKTVSESSQYYDGALFKDFIDVAAWYDFDVGAKDMLRLEKGMICKIISFELLSASNNRETVLSMNIISDDDIKQIMNLQNALKDELKQSPKLAAIVKSMDSVLSDLIKRYKDGYYRVAGQWELKSAYQAKQASLVAAKSRIVPVNRQMGILPLNGRLDE